MPNFNWSEYFKAANTPKFTAVNVTQPEFFQGMDKMLTTVALNDLKTYLRWKLVNGMANALSSNFENASFEFHGKVLSGTKEMLPRWRRCTEATDRS